MEYDSPRYKHLVVGHTPKGRPKYLIVVPEQVGTDFLIDPVIRRAAEKAKPIDIKLPPDEKIVQVESTRPIYKELNKYYLPRQLITGALCGLTIAHFTVHIMIAHNELVLLASGLWAASFLPSAYVHGEMIARKRYARQILGYPNLLKYHEVLEEIERSGTALVRLESSNFLMARSAMYDTVKAFYRLSWDKRMDFLNMFEEIDINVGPAMEGI